jgi:hypothetical protein
MQKNCCKRLVNEAIGVFPNNNPNLKNALHNNIASTNRFHKQWLVYWFECNKAYGPYLNQNLITYED